MNLSEKAFVITSSILIALIAARTYYTIVTGYILPDEAYYFNLFIVQGLGFSGYRPIMHIAYLFFFTGTTSLVQLAVRGMLFCATWALGSLFVLKKTLDELEFSDKTKALVQFSFILMPVFPLMAVFFVTETMALFLILTGIFFAVRYFKQGGWKYASLIALMFMFAAQVREPAMLFLFAMPVVLIFLGKFKLKPALNYLGIAVIGLPIPTSIHPLSLAQPVANLIFDSIPNAILSFFLHGQVHHGSGGLIPAYVFQATNTVGITVNIPALQGFVIGLAFGIGPITGILVFASPFFVRDRLGLLIASASVFGLIGFFVTEDFAVRFLPDAISLWTSNIIRLSSAAIPAVLCLGYLYSKTGPKFVYVCVMGTLLIGGLALPLFSSAIQSSQNIQGGNTDRLSLSYRAPYERMAGVAQVGSLIIVGVSQAQLYTFTSFDRNITIVGIPANAKDLGHMISEGWTRVYAYDDWVTLQNPAFFVQCQCYPAWYVNVISSHSFGNWSITPLWVDGESYALEFVE